MSNVDTRMADRLHRHKWDTRFLELALTVASWSKDKSRKVGCVIVGPKREILSTGYNGFPRGVNDQDPARHERPAKYLWTEHAERNAIYNAARVGVPLQGATIYVPWFPCADCARAIVQSGIGHLVGVQPDWHDPKYAADFKVAQELLIEGGVNVRFADGFTAPEQMGVPQPIEEPAVMGAGAGVPVRKPGTPFVATIVHRGPGHYGHAVVGRNSHTACGLEVMESWATGRGILYDSASFERVATASIIAGPCPPCIAALKRMEQGA